MGEESALPVRVFAGALNLPAVEIKQPIAFMSIRKSTLLGLWLFGFATMVSRYLAVNHHLPPHSLSPWI